MQLYPFLTGLERGYAVVSVNYRLSGEAIFPAGLQDTKAAIRWLRAHAGEYSLDAGPHRRLGRVLGRQLRDHGGGDRQRAPVRRPGSRQRRIPVRRGRWSSIGSGPWTSSRWTSSSPRTVSGPCDHNDAASPESQYLGAKITEVPDKVRLASPLTYVGEHMPPILIQHGRADNLVPFQQSVQLAETIEARVGSDRFELDLPRTRATPTRGSRRPRIWSGSSDSSSGV